MNSQSSCSTELELVRRGNSEDCFFNFVVQKCQLQAGDPDAQAQPHFQEPQLQLPFQEAQPQPQREEPQLQPLLQEALANFGVYSGFAMRSGFRIVMGRSGSKRRKAAKVDAALGPVATVVGGIVVVIAIF